MVFLLDIKQRIEGNKEVFFSWRRERDHEDVKTDRMEIEEYFANVMYADLVELHRIHNASDFEIASYIRDMNDLVQSILEDLVLENYRNWFHQMDKMEEPNRTKRLSDLMDNMMSFYQIPLFNYEVFKEQHPEVFKLYSQISQARDL